MRADVIRVYRAVHTWTGILTGLILFIAFYAGALTMFEGPLERWISPPAGPGAMDPGEMDPGAADTLIAGTLATRPDARDGFTLELAVPAGSGGGARPLRLTWGGTRLDPAPWGATLRPDGTVAVASLRHAGLGQLMDDVHRTVGLPGDHELGTTVTGLASALYVVALVSGVIVLLPSLVKDAFALRVGRNLKRMWLDAHNALGILSLPFHVVIALTAVVFGLHDHFYDAQDAVVYEGRMGEIMRASSPGMRVAPDPSPAPMLPAAALLDRVRALEPGMQPFSVQYVRPGTRSAQVRVWGHDPRHLVRHSSFVTLSAVTGAVIDDAYLGGHQGPWTASTSAFFALHFGTFGGEPVRWAYFLLGLSGAFLFYSGNLLWIESRRRRERHADRPVVQSLSTTLLAAGTVGVCLGCVAGLSLTIAAAKWLHGTVADLNGWLWAVYHVAFLAACAWASLRGAARAGGELLWAAAAATAAIPATTALAWMAPGLGLWVSAEWGVDAVALAGALAFAWMALAAGRRAKTGPRDSVWSARPRPVAEYGG